MPLDLDEPERLAATVAKMKLSFAVVTSVTRDDLEDGGASHFVAVIKALKKRIPGIGIEVLVPDFNGSVKALKTVLDASPSVLNHNVETVAALYSTVRPGADYKGSLSLLKEASLYKRSIPTKSGIMVGLGEKADEVEQVISDLRSVGVSLLTIGQYLKPEANCLDVQEYIPPKQFEAYARIAKDIGFKGVSSGPFVRSSHKAGELYAAYQESRNNNEQDLDPHN